MKLTKLKLGLAGLLGLISVGCMSTSKLDARIQEIRQKHSVEIRAENPLSRCYLFGYLPGLLNRIDEDLGSEAVKYFFLPLIIWLTSPLSTSPFKAS